jgi:hypothetical protein
MLTHWSGPTVLAVLLALLSLPLVAISLDAVQAPPGVGAMNCRGGLIDSREPCIYDGLPLADLGRWSAAAGAVLAAALISGTIGGWIVRRHAKMGGLLTVLLAWEVAIAAIPLLPATFHLDVAFAHAEGWMPLIRSTEPTSGLSAAGNPSWVLISPLYEPVSLVLLLVGVVVWTKLLRWFPVSGSETTSQIRVDIPSPVDDAGVGASR